MLRAYLVEMTVLRDYARSLLGLGLIVAACVSLGMRTTMMAPGLLTMMYLLLGVSGTNSFDDLNGWGAFASRCRSPAATWWLPAMAPS